jgi:hypothetical protein
MTAGSLQHTALSFPAMKSIHTHENSTVLFCSTELLCRHSNRSLCGTAVSLRGCIIFMLFNATNAKCRKCRCLQKLLQVKKNECETSERLVNLLNLLNIISVILIEILYNITSDKLCNSSLNN